MGRQGNECEKRKEEEFLLRQGNLEALQPPDSACRMNTSSPGDTVSLSVSRSQIGSSPHEDVHVPAQPPGLVDDVQREPGVALVQLVDHLAHGGARHLLRLLQGREEASAGAG